MKLITRENYIDVSSLSAEPEMDINEMLKPLGILRLNVDEFFTTGIERLSVVLVEPYLKMTNSARNWTIYQKDRYAIAETSGDMLLVTPWSLDSEESFSRLTKELSEGKMLVALQDDGYRIVARSTDVDSLTIEKDYSELWREVCRGYLEQQILGLVRWSYQSRRTSRLDPLIRDVALRYVKDGEGVEETSTPGECFSANSYFMDTIHELISPLVKDVSEFVQQDLWAYYSLTIDRQAVNVIRHRDARALIWNKTLIDLAEENELENEVLSAWAQR